MKFGKNVRKYGAPMLIIPLAAAFVVETPSTVEASATNPYTDVTVKDGHYAAIVDLTEKGIVTGVTKTQFQSTKPATRGEAAQFIVNALGLNETAGVTTNFKDLPASSPYYQAVGVLYERKIIGGYSDDTFRPNATLKRAEIAKMLTLAFELDVANVTTTKFADVNAISDAATKRYIQTLIDYSITAGTTETAFSPYGTLTRGQLATFLSRSMDAVEEDLTILRVE